MSVIEGIKLHNRLFGIYGILLVSKSRMFRKTIEVSVQTEGIRYPLYLRLRTSDVSLFEEIILNEEYSLKIFKSPRIIIDAGANIGLSSVFFANKYPDSKILAIEPEHTNFEMLKKNAFHYSNIIPINKALWKDNGKLCIYNPGTDKWGYQTRQRCDNEKSEGIVYKE